VRGGEQGLDGNGRGTVAKGLTNERRTDGRGGLAALSVKVGGGTEFAPGAH